MKLADALCCSSCQGEERKQFEYVKADRQRDRQADRCDRLTYTAGGREINRKLSRQQAVKDSKTSINGTYSLETTEWS